MPTMSPASKIGLVTLKEMVQAMRHVGDDEVFRWFQDSYTSSDGIDVIINAGVNARAKAER